MELQSAWGWQPALYLFLGGMGAGAFIMAAILYLKDRERNARIVCVFMWAAAISLIVGLLLLLMELVTPLRGLLMGQLQPFHVVDDLRRVGRVRRHCGVRHLGAIRHAKGSRVAEGEVLLVCTA